MVIFCHVCGQAMREFYGGHDRMYRETAGKYNKNEPQSATWTPSDESETFKHYNTIFWWMNIHLPIWCSPKLLLTNGHWASEVPGKRAPTRECREACIEDGCRAGIARFTARCQKKTTVFAGGCCWFLRRWMGFLPFPSKFPITLKDLQTSWGLLGFGEWIVPWFLPLV